MIRWLLIALFIYLLYKLIKGPKSKRKKNIHFRFGVFQNRNSNSSNKNNRDLDQIEEAEFEDITNKEKKTKNS